MPEESIRFAGARVVGDLYKPPDMTGDRFGSIVRAVRNPN